MANSPAPWYNDLIPPKEVCPIWIKETTVTTRNGQNHYCQLMQTQYTGHGTSRQRLVLSLGRTDRLDLAALREMAAAVTQGKTDVLTPWLLSVLPGGKEYGPAALLLKAMESLDLPRFCGAAARETGAPPGTLEALTALTTYYLLSYQRGTPFFHWLEQCYIPAREQVNEETIRAAAGLFLRRRHFHPGLAAQARRALEGAEWGFSYAVPCQYDFLPDDCPQDALFLLSGEDIPLECALWERAAPERLPEMIRRSVLLTRDPELMARRGLTPENCRFICGSSTGEPPAFARDSGAIAAFLREEGEFLPFREYGYRERSFGALRAVILRSSPGQASALTQWHKEPRELILTNTDLPVEKVLEKLLFLDKVLDIIHPVYLTEDLQFLRLWYSPEEILDILSGMQFFQLFLCLYLGRRLARCRTTLDDALAALGGLRCVPLRWEGGSVLLTTPADSRQQEILESV